MQKITFRNFFKKAIIFSFVCITQIVLGQDKSVAIETSFSNVESAVSAKTDTYKLSYKNTSPFVMLSGYTKNLNFNNTVYYRLKSNNTWSEWSAFKEAHNGDDMDRFVLGEVFIEQAFEDIQFKTDRPTDTPFTFRLFFPEYTKNIKTGKSEIAANKQVAGGCAQPAYQGRNDWCPSGDCPKSTSPSAMNPTHIVVHHSAGQTTNSDFAAVVRGYWDYHVNSNGWADIGYNWLVDPNGVIYEGRGDRIRGAHSPCMNSTSTGICFIGNYEGSTQPSTAGLNALKDFIAWEATDKGIDIKTSSTVSGLGMMPHISGHKDGKDSYPASNCTATACPGANLHSKLATIINDVAAYACYISSANAPKTPVSFSAVRKSATSVEIKIKAVTSATKYGVYKSTDNTSFQKVTESASTTILIENLTQGEVYYFKVEAINNDGVSERSSVLTAMPSQYTSEILIIDGVERRTWDVVAEYDYPLSQLNRSFSSATNEAVQDGTINLDDFKFVIWSLLDESTADDTFNKSEQTIVKNYIDNGGVFIVSGNEIGWDLVERGDATDKTFYETVLKADYIGDNPNPLNYVVKDNNGLSYNLVQNPNDFIDARWPDAILPLSGASKTFTFDGVSETSSVAGIGYKTSLGGVEYLSFAIESVTNDEQRKQLLEYIFNKHSSLLAVEDSFIKQNISLYPNPSSGVIRVSNPNFVKISNISIFNIYGQQLRSNYKNQAINLGNFTPGVYLIKIEDENGKQGTFRIMKR